MKKIFLTSLLISVFPVAYAQNVGIGTNTPVAKLQGAGNVVIDSGLRVSAKNLQVPLVVEGSPVNENIEDQKSLQFDDFSTSPDPAWQSFTAGATGTMGWFGMFFTAAVTNPFNVEIYKGIGTQGTLLQRVPLIFKTNGWYYIGTSIPVEAGQTYTIYLDEGDLWGYSNTDNYSGGISSYGNSRDYMFSTGISNFNAPLLRIENNGNVGMGVMAPAERLDVKGNIKASGNLVTGGNIQGGNIQATGNLNIGGLIAVPAPQTFFLINSWTNYGETYGNATYYKDKQSVVRLSGLVRNGTSPLIAQLPPGHRPAKDLIFTVVSGLGFARLDIKANGDVRLMDIYSNLYVSLDGIAFRVD